MSDNKEITLADIHKELKAIRRINANTFFVAASILSRLMDDEPTDEVVTSINGRMDKIFNRINKIQDSFRADEFS